MASKTENAQFFNILNQGVSQDIKKSFVEADLNANIYWISSVSHTIDLLPFAKVDDFDFQDSQSISAG